MDKNEALVRAIRDLSRELQELVEDGVRLGWTVTLNKSSGIMTLRSPAIHGSPEVIAIPRGERSLNEGKSRAWHTKLRRYADPARLNAQDREMLSPRAEEARPRIPTASSPPKPSDLPSSRPVVDVDLEKVQNAAERARRAQEAVNALGAGPPNPGVQRESEEVRKRQFNGRKTRARPCLICGKLKKNMGPHYKWHRERGEILVVKKNGQDVELTTTPEQAGVDMRAQELQAVTRPTKHMAMQEALDLIYDAAKDALGIVEPKELMQQIAELQKQNQTLRQDNTDLRAKLARIQNLFE